MDGFVRWANTLPVLILNTLTPVFLLIALGAVLQRTGFVSGDFLREANRVTYWLGLPALMFSQLTSSVHRLEEARLMFSVMFLATALAVVVAYIAAWTGRVSPGAVGTFVQGAFRGNLAFIGLPIMFAMPDTPGPGGLSARTAAVIVVAPMMVVYNIGAVVVLLLSQHRLGFGMIRPLVRQMATTPPLIASVAGILFALMRWPIPAAVDKTFFALGEMALPLGLLGVGGSLVSVKIGRAWHLPLSSALVKSVISPVLGWGVARLLGLDGLELRVVLVLLACPTAIVSYTMALQLRGDEALASGSIVLSTLLSVASLAFVVGFF